MRLPNTTMRRFIQSGLYGLAAIAVAATASAIAGDSKPYSMADGSWITIEGTVASVRPNIFTLDYGDGEITVEMDDGDRDADAYKLLVGDKVIVSGKIDDDFYEITTIEASSVYVENLGTTFFASPTDEEGFEGWAAAVAVPMDDSETVVYGTVTDVGGKEFTVDSGPRKLQVEVDEMPYNPLDDEGYLKIRIGDRVKVRGHIDSNFFTGRELEAESVVKLNIS